jgi:hypothetical protein
MAKAGRMNTHEDLVIRRRGEIDLLRAEKRMGRVLSARVQSFRR